MYLIIQFYVANLNFISATYPFQNKFYHIVIAKTNYFRLFTLMLDSLLEILLFLFFTLQLIIKIN